MKIKRFKDLKRDGKLVVIISIALVIVILNHILFDDNKYILLGGVIICILINLYLVKILFCAFRKERKSKKIKGSDTDE